VYPVAQVAAALLVADVQVTVAALATATQVVHSLALSQVPAAQLIAHVSAAPAPPVVCFGYQQEHVGFRESAAVVHVVVVPVAAFSTAVQSAQSDVSSAAKVPAEHASQVPAASRVCLTAPVSASVTEQSRLDVSA